jgi:hypothetical protein
LLFSLSLARLDSALESEKRKNANATMRCDITARRSRKPRSISRFSNSAFALRRAAVFSRSGSGSTRLSAEANHPIQCYARTANCCFDVFVAIPLLLFAHFFSSFFSKNETKAEASLKSSSDERELESRRTEHPRTEMFADVRVRLVAFTPDSVFHPQG